MYTCMNMYNYYYYDVVYNILLLLSTLCSVYLVQFSLFLVNIPLLCLVTCSLACLADLVCTLVPLRLELVR